MQTRTKYKSSNNSRAAFIFAVCLCILGAATNFVLFYKNFYRTLSKLNEEPIAQITFKYKTAERRFLERPVWDRLKKLSYLYNGDTVHTVSGAEATITFIDGNVMLLSESTIAQVFYTEGNAGKKTASARLSGGQVTVDSSLSDNGFSLDSAGNVLTLESGGKLSATNVSSSDGADAENAANSNSVQILSGVAKVLNSEGVEQAVTEGEVFELEKEEIEVSRITLLTPSPNEKIIYHTEGLCEILFNWKAENISSSSNLALQIFSDKKMKNLVLETDVSEKDSYQALLSGGNYYWKMTLSNASEQTENEASQGEKSLSGKFQVMQSLAPVLIAPKQNYLSTYSTKNPSLRFVWSESDFADYYELEIASDNAFENQIYSERVSQTSRTLQTLSEGTYFWRVTPFFRTNGEGFASSSETGTFTIEKRIDLSAPALLTPQNESFINLEKDFAKTYFSWKRDRNAFEYEFLANDADDFENPKIVLNTDKNFISISSSDSLAEGKWFWRVRMKDSDGNVSPYSETRSFYAANGNVEIRTIEPSDGFRVAETLVPDTRFTWKQNLPQDVKTKIYIATDEKMQNLVYSSVVPEFGISGINLKEGEYFWSLGTSEDSAIQVSSSPKRLVVSGLLNEATLIQPLGKTVVREGIPYDFEWSEVFDADYYRIDVFRSSTEELVYSNNIYETSVSVDMFSGKGFVDNEDYRYEIQARANAIQGVQSRRSGKISEGRFHLIKLRPVQIDSPKRNTRFDGAEAILNPESLVWSSVTDVSFAQVIVTKTDERPNQIVIKIPSDSDMESPNGRKIAPNRILLDTKDGLQEGTYEIVVKAETTEGYDISNTEEKYKGRFSVGPVPPLEETKNLVSDPQRFDMAYFIENIGAEHYWLNLSWDKINEATGYEVSIYESNSRNLLLRFETEEPSFSLDLLSLSEDERQKLQNGIFKWNVQGIRRIDSDKDGVLDKILQRSRGTESGEFEIDVPKPKKSKARGVRNPYGEN